MFQYILPLKEFEFLYFDATHTNQLLYSDWLAQYDDRVLCSICITLWQRNRNVPTGNMILYTAHMNKYILLDFEYKIVRVEFVYIHF